MDSERRNELVEELNMIADPFTGQIVQSFLNGQQSNLGIYSKVKVFGDYSMLGSESIYKITTRTST